MQSQKPQDQTPQDTYPDNTNSPENFDQPTVPESSSEPVDNPTPPAVTPAPQTRKKLSKRKLLVIVGLAVAVVGGLAVYAFAFYLPSRPENVWSSALTNTGRGYDRLIEYAASTDLKEKYQKSDLSGSFKFQSADFQSDGTFKFATDGTDATFSGDIGLGVTRIKAEGIGKDAVNSDSPDLYFKVSGIKGFGVLLGVPQLDSLDDQWIAVDHTLLDSMVANGESAPAIANPSRESIVEAAEVVGTVSKKYLFTTDEGTAVFKMRQYNGTEQVDGKETMHFTVGVSKNNLKDFVEELGNELDGTELSAWTKNTLDKPLSQLLELDKIVEGVEEIDETATFDAWVNTATKTLHKVRFSADQEPDNNYMELIFNYDGGPELPFALNLRSTTDGQDTTATFGLTLNTETDTFNVAINAKDESAENAFEFSFDSALQPGNGNINAEAPEGAITVLEALDKTGLSGLFDVGGIEPEEPFEFLSL